jgi:LysM repeat protein
LKKSGKTRLWIFLLVIAIVILIVWQVFARGLLGFGHPGLASVSTLPVSSTTVGLSTLPISPTQSQNTPTPTILMTPSATLPIQTATLTILLPHALETPIGLDYKLIIHRVALGESLPSMAAIYGTTAEAIQAVNYNLPLPLVVDRLVIVPINQTDIHGLPAFEAYEVKADVVVETLAQQLAVDPSLLKLYNGLKDGEPLSTGDWLLIPHVGTATP